MYVDLYFTYLEINPLVVTGDSIHILDLAAKLDTTADFICRPEWGEIEYPPPFGRDAYPEEAYIADLDAKSGASLKLTILNPKGRIWTMVAGGGKQSLKNTILVSYFLKLSLTNKNLLQAHQLFIRTLFVIWVAQMSWLTTGNILEHPMNIKLMNTLKLSSV